MSLLDVVRLGVRVADGVTKPLQTSVSYERFLSTDAYGARAYAVVIALRAIVEGKQQHVKMASGLLAISRVTITLLDVAALTIATSGGEISVNDRITLADGTTSPILTVGGFVDAGTGTPVATEVFLG